MLGFVLLSSLNEQKLMQSMKMSISPENIKRDTDVIINLFGNMVRSTDMASNIMFFRMSFKEAYPKVFITTVPVPVIYSLVALALAVLFF